MGEPGCGRLPDRGGGEGAVIPRETFRKQRDDRCVIGTEVPRFEEEDLQFRVIHRMVEPLRECVTTFALRVRLRNV